MIDQNTKIIISYQELEFHDKQIRANAIEECADLFAEILSNISNICGTNCPVKCNWGTEDTCEDMCKKWFIEQLKEQSATNEDC